MLAACSSQVAPEVPLPKHDPTRLSHVQHAQVGCVECHTMGTRPGSDDHKPCDRCHAQAFLVQPGELCKVCHSEVTPPRAGEPLAAPLRAYPSEDIWQAEPSRCSRTAPTWTPACSRARSGSTSPATDLPHPRRQARPPRSRDVRALPRRRGEPERSRHDGRVCSALPHRARSDCCEPARAFVIRGDLKVRSREPPQRLAAAPRSSASNAMRGARSRLTTRATPRRGSRTASGATTTATARPKQRGCGSAGRATRAGPTR